MTTDPVRPARVHPLLQVWRGIVLFGLLLMLAYCYNWATQPSKTSGEQASSRDPVVKAEDIITFKPDYVICLTRELHTEFVGYAVRGERTKEVALLESGRCALNGLSLGHQFKVIHVERGLIEFVPYGSTAAVGMWTAIEAAVPSSAPSR